MLPPGFEPGIAVPKTAVISISPREQVNKGYHYSRQYGESRYNDGMEKINLVVPKEARETCETLKKAGFDAYLVGGCVRDLLLEKEPKDWDITTNANPEQIQGPFP